LNYLWPIMIIISIITGFFNGCAEETVNAGLSAAQNSINVLLSFAGMMCFWSGILHVAESSGVIAAAEKLIRPVTRILFPKLKKGDTASRKITANIAANILGMGNAATPAGIDAMAELDILNKKKNTPSDEMCIFTVLNTASVQIIPTTVISLRAAAGSVNPTSVLIPIWICSVISLISAIMAMRLILKIIKKDG